MSVIVAFLVMLSNIGWIEKTDSIKAIQVNTSSYNYEVFIGKSNETILAFNTNYYWKNIPIGLIQSRRKKIASTVYPYCKWPIFTIKDGKASIEYKQDNEADIQSQIGPTILFNGEYAIEKIHSEGFYKKDSTRKTSHIAIGVKRNGRFIVAYFKNASMSEMADKFKKWGCYASAKCDGGHSCYLRFQNFKVGTEVKAGIYVY